MPASLQLYYRIVKVELVQFATLVNTYDASAKNTLENEVAVSYDVSSRVLYCTLTTIMKSEDDAPIMKAVMRCGFEFKQESIDAVTKDGKITFPASALGHIASLTYSSLRGALSQRTEDTPFAGYVLPLDNIYNRINHPYIVQVVAEKQSFA